MTIQDSVDTARDAAADAIAAHDSPELREAARLGRRLEDLAEELAELAAAQAERFDTLIDDARRTTMPRRLLYLGIGAAVGAAAAALADPDRGSARRAQLRDQTAARGRDLVDTASGSVQHAASVATGRARGAVSEALEDSPIGGPPDDPKLLRQRIRSEVFGHRDDTSDVVIVVHDPGVVTLKGVVPSDQALHDLPEAVRAVSGVEEVQVELSVRD